MDLAAYVADVRDLLSRGRPARAFELAREGIAAHGPAPRLRHLAALALARGGNARAAGMAARELLAAADVPDEVRGRALSLLGRLEKDRFAAAARSRPADARPLARASAEYYERAFRLSGEADPYYAVNAATMRLLAGDPGLARGLAARLLALLERGGPSPHEDDLWGWATRGEALLVAGRPGADEAYRRVAAAGSARLGDLSSIRRQLRLIEAAAPVPADVLAALAPGAVVAYSGHLADRPGRPAPRWPADTTFEAAVRARVRAALDRLDARVGYGSAAAGADLVFAEELLARGAELHVVLPFALEDFYRTSVDFGRPERAAWRARCDTVLGRAAEVHYATRERHLGDDRLFDFANRVIQGLALTRAEELAAEPVAVAALGRSAAAAAEPAPGGTADFLRRWTDLGRRAEVVDCDEIVGTGQGEGPGERSEQPPGGPAGPAGRREVKAMLFADVKGFSRLAEEQTPAFFGHFLAAVDGLLKEAPAGPTFGNTWGDGLYLVFDEPADCAAFGTQLRDRVGRTDFPALGLPADLAVRVGTHAGPVFRGPDPVIGRENYFGSHVTRAARIEPVTTPGCVYASEQMAALLAVDAAAGFRCGYVGEEHLAKGYDRCPLYVVEHAADG